MVKSSPWLLGKLLVVGRHNNVHETYGSQSQGKKHVHQVTAETKGSAEWFSMDDSNLDPEDQVFFL